MKKKLCILTCFLLIIFSSGCRSNDDNDNENQVVAIFQLQNEDGVECYDFHEGENIIFRLEIKNNTDKDVMLPPIAEIIGYNIFHVYSESGEDMGMPWDELVTNNSPSYIIGAHSSAVKTCPWFNIPALSINGHEYSECFYKKGEKPLLPRGKYYSEFDIKLGDEIITCDQTFQIRDKEAKGNLDTWLNDTDKKMASDPNSIIGIWELKTLCYPDGNREIPSDDRDLFMFNSSGKVMAVIKKGKPLHPDLPNEDREYGYSYDKEKQILLLCGESLKCIITDGEMHIIGYHYGPDDGLYMHEYIFIKKI